MTIREEIASAGLEIFHGEAENGQGKSIMLTDGEVFVFAHYDDDEEEALSRALAESRQQLN